MDSVLRLKYPFPQEGYPDIYDNRIELAPSSTRFDTSIDSEHGYLEAEPDLPFDDFDRELLAGASLDGHFSGTYGSVVNRSALDDVSQFSKYHAAQHLQTSGSDCTSSDTNMSSSPTVTMLRKKQGFANTSAWKSKRCSQIPRSWEHREQTPSFSDSCDAMLQAISVNEPVVRGIRLIPTSRLPDLQRSFFQFKIFNAVQSKCFPTAYETDDNLVVSAPTGSGKTVIMELAMLRLTQDMVKGAAKMVYLAPTKSLCSERCQDWQQKFNVFGIHCAELTGDTDYGDLQAVQKASVIVTTPEKWDSITRKWTDQSRLIRLIKLFLIDEVHVIGDDRGATVEAIVSRMKCAGHNIRLIALSATIPNSDDIAAWLTRGTQNRSLPAIREVFDNSFRPVELVKHIIACDGTSNPWAFDNSLTEKIPDIVARFAKGKPTMIFCATKDSAQKTAIVLAESRRNSRKKQTGSDNATMRVAVTNDLLQKVLSAGVAFHHASLSLPDRKTVEQGFLNGDVDIICCTSTLAIGVNLPCYLVVLKGICGYSNSGLREYSGLEVMQMLGRAGRPQFETEACAVVLCQKQHREKYATMVAGEETLESSLHQNLIEHLNAEISIGTIRNVVAAKEWLQSTFLYIRLQKNEKFYNMDPDHEYRSTDEALMAWCEKDLNLLQDAELIKSHDSIEGTEYGRAMAKYCVKFDTMKIFMTLPHKAKTPDILKGLASAAEFVDFRVKQKEKKMYKEINKANETRFPISVDIALSQHKVSLILQAKLGGIQVDKISNSGKTESFTGQIRQLQADTQYVFDHCRRLIRCLVDVMVQRDDSVAAKSALEMARSIAAQAWDDTYMQLKQIQGIGDVFARKLAAAGIKSVDALSSAEPHRVEVILSKNPPFGQVMHERSRLFPLLHVSTKEVGKRHVLERGAEVKVFCEVGFVNKNPATTFNRRGFKVLFLCETSSGDLLDFRCFPAGQLRTKQEFTLTLLIREQVQDVKCHVMCDDVAGTHRFAGIRLDCPTFWFPTKDARNSAKSGNTNRSTSLTFEDHMDGFSEYDLDDADLMGLVQAPSPAPGQDIHDIDDILSEVTKEPEPKKPQKRKGFTEPSSDDHLQASVQLPNGNWTCRHPCRDKKMDCKHPCCKEGVKKKPAIKWSKKDTSEPTSTTGKGCGQQVRAAAPRKKDRLIENFLTGANEQIEERNATKRKKSLSRSSHDDAYGIDEENIWENRATDRAYKDVLPTRKMSYTAASVTPKSRVEDSGYSSDLYGTSFSDQLELSVVDSPTRERNDLDSSNNPLPDLPNETPCASKERPRHNDDERIRGGSLQFGTTVVENNSSDIKQKQYWDSLDNDFLTHENFGFITIVPD